MRAEQRLLKNLGKKKLKQDELKNKKEVLFARIGAYESLFDFDTAYKYTKEQP